MTDRHSPSKTVLRFNYVKTSVGGSDGVTVTMGFDSLGMAQDVHKWLASLQGSAVETAGCLCHDVTVPRCPKHGTPDRTRSPEEPTAHLTNCRYCRHPAQADGSIFHEAGCDGLETVRLNRLQYDALCDRATPVRASTAEVVLPSSAEPTASPVQPSHVKASAPNGACGSFKSGYRQGWCVNCGKKGTEHELSSLTTSGPQCNGRCTFDTEGHGKLVLANVDCPLHGLGSAENGTGDV